MKKILILILTFIMGLGVHAQDLNEQQTEAVPA